MTDYNLLFEKIVLAAWKVTWRREDSFQLGIVFLKFVLFR